MIEDVRIFVTVSNNDDAQTDISKSFSTRRDEKAIDKAIEYLEKVKQQPIKR